MTKKWLKLKYSGKTPKDVIWRLAVKRQVETVRGESPKMVLSLFLDSFPLFNAKRLTIKAFLEVALLSLILRAHYFLKLLKKCWQFRCAGLLCSSKLDHLDRKSLPDFTWNLVQNLISLVVFSKNNRKWLKNGEN